MKTERNTVALICLMLMTSGAYAEITEQKDSWDFSHRYEWGSLWYADLDGNGSPDFNSDIRSGTITRYFGVMRLNSGYNTVVGLLNNTATNSWRVLAPTRASGFTVELRLRVNSQADPVNGAIGVTATASDSYADSFLCVGTNFVKWALNSGITLNEADNSDDFHVFRIAMEGGQAAGSEKFTVWRDGVLLGDNLTDAFNTPTLLNRLNIGDISTADLGGNVDIGYVRFTSGAYAPAHTTKYARKDSAEFDKKFEMNTAEGEVDPDGDTDEWSRSVNGAYSAELSGGSLHVTTSNKASKAFWESASWTNVITRDTPFTVEVRMRVDASINDTGDRAFLLAAGNGDALAFFTIGTNNVYRGVDATPLNSRDNSDRMHTFRVAYDGDGPTGFQFWRNGELIGTNILYAASTNRLYFGDNSSSFAGSGSFDYVRWTKGVYEPVTAPKGTFIRVR